MARTRTIAQLADRVTRVRILVLLMRPRSEIACVAAGAIGLECWARPDYSFRVVLVARGAREIAEMVKRLECQSGVHIDVWNPRDRFVAFVAFPRRNKMPRVSSGRSHAVVTRRARSKYLGMVDRHNRAPRCCAVTILADVGR